MGSLDLDYWLIESRNDRPGLLTQNEMADVIADMTAEEFLKFSSALRSYDNDDADIALRASIERQYAEQIVEKAHEMHADYLDMLKEDSKEKE